MDDDQASTMLWRLGYFDSRKYKIVFFYTTRRVRNYLATGSMAV